MRDWRIGTTDGRNNTIAPEITNAATIRGIVPANRTSVLLGNIDDEIENRANNDAVVTAGEGREVNTSSKENREKSIRKNSVCISQSMNIPTGRGEMLISDWRNMSVARVVTLPARIYPFSTFGSSSSFSIGTKRTSAVRRWASSWTTVPG